MGMSAPRYSIENTRKISKPSYLLIPFYLQTIFQFDSPVFPVIALRLDDVFSGFYNKTHLLAENEKVNVKLQYMI